MRDPRSSIRHSLAWASCIIAVSLLVQAINLHSSLPNSYAAQHWNTVWMVFDLIYVPLFVVTGLLYLIESYYFPIVASMTAAWLVADGLFDNLTAHGSDVSTARLQLIPEIGTALVVLFLAFREQHAFQRAITEREEEIE